MRTIALSWRAVACAATACGIAGLVASCAGEVEPVAAKPEAGEPVEVAAAPAAPVRPDPGPRHIIVRPEQSLGDIARRYGVPEREIVAANQMKPPYRLTAGAQLLIPITVGRGQSLKTIARGHHVPERAIVAANQIKPPYKLKVASRLLIPITVQRGQSLKTIALKHEVSEQAIVAANQMKPPYRLAAGMQLLIPGTAMPPDGPRLAAATRPPAIALDKPPPSAPQIMPATAPALAAVAPTPAGTQTALSSPIPLAPPAETKKPPAVEASAPAPAETSPPPAPEPAPPPVAELAENQERFIAAVAQARERFKTTSDPSTRRNIRVWRKDAICQALGALAVKGWVGTIDRVSSDANGKGVLKVSLAPGVRAKTWENVLADIGYDTLIEAKSSMFRTALSMKEGDRVEISGTFVKSDHDCAKVANAAQDQAIIEPEFIFRFSSLARAQ